VLALGVGCEARAKDGRQLLRSMLKRRRRLAGKNNFFI
jgi:hypothetical protein